MKRMLIFGIVMIMALSGCSDKTDVERPVMNGRGCVSIDKPVIYLYGYDNEQVTVKLDFKGKITATYPAYDKQKGWVVTAKPDGRLISTDKKNEYPYLFWEGIPDDDIEFDFSKGFCIKGTETGERLNAILKDIGLNANERADFITYWLPKMQGNEYNIVSFQTSTYTKLAKLNIEPKPKTVTRVFMAWYPSKDEVKMNEQKFNKAPRNGKYCIEWGGCKVSSVDLKPVSVFGGSDEASDEAFGYTLDECLKLSLEENAAKQQQCLKNIQNLQLAAYQIMLKQNMSGVQDMPSADMNEDGKEDTAVPQ